MISEDRMTAALTYLATTDLPFAEAEAAVLRAEYLHELVKDRVFLTSTGTVAERQAQANSSEDAIRTHEEYLAAVVRHKQMRAKRETESQVIGVYRTQESSRRLGA